MAKTIKYNAVEDKTSELNKILENLTCPHCESKFFCEIEDLYSRSSYDNRSLVVDCPVCEKELGIEDDGKYLNLKAWPLKLSGSYWDN